MAIAEPTRVGVVAMSSPVPRVAIVTGANKGIGFEIAAKIASAKGWKVIVATRDEGRGRAAVDALRKDGLDCKFRKLDLSDEGSIDVSEMADCVLVVLFVFVICNRSITRGH